MPATPNAPATSHVCGDGSGSDVVCFVRIASFSCNCVTPISIPLSISMIVKHHSLCQHLCIIQLDIDNFIKAFKTENFNIHHGGSFIYTFLQTDPSHIVIYSLFIERRGEN